MRFLATAAVLAAGTAVVGRAANLNVSSHTLSAASASLPTCKSGSIGVNTSGSPITKVTVTLSTCTGAVAGDAVYVTLHDTTITTGNYIGHGTCNLAGATPTCTISPLTGSVRNRATDSYFLEILANPAAAGTPSSSANGFTLESRYLTQTGVPATC